MIPDSGCKVTIDSVAEPFSWLFWTALMASSSGLSMKYNYFSFWISSLTFSISCLAYHPESIPYFAHPPTPSATMMIFFETKMASYPPFQTLWGCGAKAKANLKKYFFLGASMGSKGNIFLRTSLVLFMLSDIIQMYIWDNYD